MVRPARHEWRIVGPWYRWRPGEPQVRPPDGRGTRPVFQKYDSSDLVNLFLADPQKSLKFLDEDHVQDVTAGAFMFPILSKVTSTRVASPSPVRKLFLDVHKRFYLVTCELRCEAAGFPMVPRDEVGEIGFVIRRRRVEAPDRKSVV